jgi:hypothetical protein
MQAARLACSAVARRLLSLRAARMLSLPHPSENTNRADLILSTFDQKDRFSAAKKSQVRLI